MKIHIVSDLHREFGYNDFDLNLADVLILAGDTDLGVKGISWLKSLSLDIPIIYVLGNHEYYKGAYPKTLYKIKDAASNSNIHVLENESLEIDHVCFHGCTLWTDFSLKGNPAAYGSLCQSRMNDYKKIRLGDNYAKLRSIDTFRIHQTSRQWLTESLSVSEAKHNIVVTHHAPSIRSLPMKYLDDPISAAYVSDMEDLIIKHQPSYWIHGHIHTPVNYKIGNTEIICNPHGYINELYNGFNNNIVIEI
ncbi:MULTISPECIES: metallophosphoesterase [Sphingobacterium]|uniref:metallophosphoesterase n=1 Tax=Sphingobacterium TaxID=28453 RepID=UPI000963AFC8|nr:MULTISPECIES: metallophosphoesterase [Sphingobacterium]OJZ07092.1 MAG: phosphoesterase [Sphingobacterium sp. 40-24]